jgi:hypothetical protein
MLSHALLLISTLLHLTIPAQASVNAVGADGVQVWLGESGWAVETGVIAAVGSQWSVLAPSGRQASVRPPLDSRHYLGPAMHAYLRTVKAPLTVSAGCRPAVRNLSPSPQPARRERTRA